MSEEMRNIYGEKIILTPEQEKVLNYKGEKAQQVIKGVAGSGKSLVLMAKAQKLLSQQKIDDMKNEVVFFGYNNTLVQYATEYLDKDGKKCDCLKICTVDKYLNDLIRDPIFKHDIGVLNYKPIDKYERTNILKKVLRDKANRFPNQSVYKAGINEWLDEIDWAIDNGITEQNWRGNELYKKLRKNRGRHLSRKIRLGVDGGYSYELIKDYIVEIKKKRLTEYGMQYSYIEDHIDRIPAKMKFKHVLVDEAQDLSLTKIKIIKHLFIEDLVVAMDSNQRIYRNHWKFVDVDIKTHTSSLGKPFRCSKQIDEFAECIRKANDSDPDEPDDVIPHTTPVEDGPLPVVIECENRDRENRAIIKVVKENLLKNNLATTAILFKSNDDVNNFSETLTENKIDYEIIRNLGKYTIRAPGIKLATIHSAKGLEFNNVIVPYVTKRKYNRDDEEKKGNLRNMLYVAFTRARNQLFLTYSDKRSQYLNEIDEKYYKLLQM